MVFCAVLFIRQHHINRFGILPPLRAKRQKSALKKVFPMSAKKAATPLFKRNDGLQVFLCFLLF
jgi:hypothetical protein